MLWFLFSCGNGIARAEILENFTEPYEIVKVATAESGVVQRLEVREGQKVSAGQMLASLDTEVLAAHLETARAKANNTAKRQAADTELQVRRTRLEKIRILHSEQHASPQELDRAEADVDIARANVDVIREEQHLAELEARGIEVQLARRQALSPINGVVIQLHKKVGEFVAANEPHLATVARLDRLKVKFYLATDRATNYDVDQVVPLLMAATKQRIEGKIEFISPVTDPNTGTVRVDVVIENPESAIRGGIRCRLLTDPANGNNSAVIRIIPRF